MYYFFFWAKISNDKMKLVKNIYFYIIYFLDENDFLNYIICFKQYYKEMIDFLIKNLENKKLRYSDKKIINSNLKLVKKLLPFSFDINRLLGWCYNL